MPKPTPLNQGALEAAAEAEYPHLFNGMMEKRLARLGRLYTPEQARESAENKRAEKIELIARHVGTYLSALTSKADALFTVENLQNFRAIVESGTPLARNTVLRLIEQARELVADQSVSNSVEELDAKIHLISWDPQPECGHFSLKPDETFVGVVVRTDRSWSLGDKATLRIERPEVDDAT